MTMLDHMMKTSVPILILALAYVRGQVVRFGKCPTVTTKATLDLNRYLGVWYEIQKFPALFELNQKCVAANYTLKDDGHINVDNSGYRSGSKVTAVGDAYVPDVNNPAKLLVRFSSGAPYGDYWVLDTDYTTYSVIYSCGGLLGFAHVEFAWILSRQKTLSEDIVKRLRQKMTDFNIDVVHFVIEDQTNCI